MRHPAKDPTSMGSLLLRFGLKRAELHQALDYQASHPGVQIGQACVRLGYIDPLRVEIAAQKQAALRRHAVQEYLDLAAKQTRKMSRDIEAMHIANGHAIKRYGRKKS